MALPPEHITIKRRRDDEPVDTLYIQQKRQRLPFQWCRVDSRETSTKGITSSAQPLAPSTSRGALRHDDARACVPTVQATSPSEDEINEHYSSPRPLPCHQKDVHNAILEAQVKTVVPEPSSPSSVVQSGLKRRHSSKHLFRPRTFLFSSRLAYSSSPVAPVRGNPKLKRHRKDLAVFVERTKRAPQTQDTLRRTTTANIRLAQIGGDTQKDDHHGSGSRKIPISDVIDKGGRSDSSIKLADGVVNPSTGFKESLGGGDLDTMVAEQLHQIASSQSFISTQSPGTMSYDPQPKIKPKPPKPRPQGKQMKSVDSGGDDVADGMVSPENEDEFVYDTYVRSSGQQGGIPTDVLEPYHDETNHIDTSKIGILIIPEHDQAVWETFGEEEESDKDWNSEEEDENAEDFYGNDYPEDEINSDDEFGMGAYDYRHRTSEDEEFDEAEGWSDEEGEAQHPWQRSGWRVRLQDSVNHEDCDH